METPDQYEMCRCTDVLGPQGAGGYGGKKCVFKKERKVDEVDKDRAFCGCGFKGVCVCVSPGEIITPAHMCSNCLCVHVCA